MRVLSVDLGTSNTVAVLSAHERPPRVVDVDGASMMPSAVFATEDGQLVAGREAERRARMDPARFEPNPKRRVDEGTLLLGDKVVAVTDALAAVLRKVADETSRQLGGQRPDEVRLTHPAQWGPVRRNVLLSAARQSGLGANLVLVPEPVAAAAHFASFPGQSLSVGQALAVYDLGAGTFDVAVVGATQNGYTVLAESGLPDLGGLDVDQALLQHVGRQVAHRDPHGWQRLLMPASTADRRAGRALREDVRAAKEALSSHPQTDLPLPEPFGDVLVTRVELEALIRPNLLRSVELLASTIRSTGLAAGQLAGVYLVGGSSRIPLVATLIAEHLRIVPTSLDQPETAVALGAHHVAKEGGVGRTQRLAGAVPAARADERTTSIVPPPRPAPHPAAHPPMYTPPRPVPPPFLGHPHPVSGARHRRPVWPWLAGAGALVVVGAVVLVVSLSGNGNSGSGSGGQTATGQGACAGQRPGQDQYTPCLQQVVRTVADGGDNYCRGAAPDGAGEVARAYCQPVDDKLGTIYLTYIQYDDLSKVTDHVDDALGAYQLDRSKVNIVGWSGGGMDGEYVVNDKLEQLIAWIKDRPIVLELSGSKKGAIGELAPYFENTVKPS